MLPSKVRLAPRLAGHIQDTTQPVYDTNGLQVASLAHDDKRDSDLNTTSDNRDILALTAGSALSCRILEIVP